MIFDEVFADQVIEHRQDRGGPHDPALLQAHRPGAHAGLADRDGPRHAPAPAGRAARRAWAWATLVAPRTRGWAKRARGDRRVCRRTARPAAPRAGSYRSHRDRAARRRRHPSRLTERHTDARRQDREIPQGRLLPRLRARGSRTSVQPLDQAGRQGARVSTSSRSPTGTAAARWRSRTSTPRSRPICPRG